MAVADNLSAARQHVATMVILNLHKTPLTSNVKSSGSYVRLIENTIVLKH